MKTHKIAVFAVLLAVLAVACGGRVERYMSQPGPNDTAGPIPGTCQPGEIIPCPCLGGKFATQECAADGKSYGPCSCGTPEQDAGMADAVPSSDGNATSDVQPGSDAGQSDAGSDAIATDSPADAPADVQQDVQTDGGITANVFLASNPVSGVLIKKEQNAAVVGIGVSATKSSITLKSLTLTCQAQIASQGCSFASQCARQACAQRITSLRIVDAATKMQFGYAMAPDPATGKATISNVNITIPANMGVNLTVVASLASTTSTTEPFDKIAVGIEQPWEANIGEKMANVEDDLKNQLGAAPSIVQTIRPSGTLSIVDDGHPASAIVVTGQNYWIQFARYKATVQYESAKIDRIRVMSTSYGFSDTADYAAIAVAANGQVVGQGVFIPGTQTGERDVDLSSNPIAIPKDGSVKFELWAKMAPVVSWSVNPSKIGIARSGHSSGLGIINDVLIGEWDANYVGKLNVRTTGDVSGERLYAPAALPNSQIAAAQPGNHMVLRKSKPVITKLPAQSSLVQLGDNAAYHFMVTADTSSVGIAQFAFEITSSKGVAYVPYLLKGGQNVNAWSSAYDPSGDICVWGYGNYCYTGTRRFLWQLQNEEVLAAGSTADYTVMVKIVNNAPPPGSSIAVKFVEQGSLYTASLTNFNCTNSISLGFGLDSDKYVRPGLIWSDLSEVPHGYQVNCTKSWSSADWIGDVYVKDLSQVQTLIAP